MSIVAEKIVRETSSFFVFFLLCSDNVCSTVNCEQGPFCNWLDRRSSTSQVNGGRVSARPGRGEPASPLSDVARCQACPSTQQFEH